MIILEQPSQIKQLNLERIVCTVGVFDGVHIGHQKLIQTIAQTAKNIGGKSVVITFDQHPYNILNSSIHIPRLTLPAHKIKLLDSLGVDICIIMKFNKEIASISAESWIKEILWGQLHIDAIYLGEDTFFGKDQKGDIDLLSHWGRQLGFKAVKLDMLRLEKLAVNSTSIRNFIMEGHLEMAEKLLGRPYSIFGAHIKGTGRGHGLGFPTINLDTQDQCMPPLGIYAVKVDKNIPAVANLGVSPTFNERHKKPVLEIHLLSAEKPLNFNNIEVTFIKKLRNEIKFNTIPELIEQIEKDISQAKTLFFSL